MSRFTYHITNLFVCCALASISLSIVGCGEEPAPQPKAGDVDYDREDADELDEEKE